jgi:probable F420-dependent oxidoreductase
MASMEDVEMTARALRFVAQVVLNDDFEKLAERVLAVERAGFAAVLVPDHFYTGESQLSSREGIGESWTTVAALGARTSRIRVGGAVMCNLFRHPCLTAQTAATVDRITNGRLELGLGAGWLVEEFRRTGLPFPRTGVRIQMLEEALRIVLPALEGEPVHLDGEFYQVRDFSLQPTAVQKPRPPLHVGGGGDRILRLAARYADIVSLIPPASRGRIEPEAVKAFDAARFEERVGWLRQEAERAGRDPAAIEVMAFSAVSHITENAEQSAQVIRTTASMFQLDEATTRAHPMVLVGTPAEITATLEERRERWGIGSYMLRSPSPEICEIFGKEILPRFTGR